VSLTNTYLDLKLQELYLSYEFECKREEEREELRQQREMEKEQQALAREIAEKQKKILKDETHFKKALEELTAKRETVSEAEKESYEKRIKELEEKLQAFSDERADLDYRIQNTGAGYVYIISNIGAFGESVFKIGTTRRLEPLERIKELGDASVPFGFDVHALIFSHNAYNLESTLHKAFEKYKLNKVNPRKEFFAVSIQEIENVIRTHHDAVVEFVKIPEAEEYRKSLMMVKS
jgi:DNA repair exonuclease SbcCD ATPase subunit